jgi:hypothetical protein
MTVKQQLMPVIILIAVLFISGCTGSYNTLQAKYMVGEVVVVGNEPFTHLAIQTGPSSIMILDCDKETKDFLLNNQGKTAKIFFEKLDDTKTPNVIYVKKYEIISKVRQ